MPSAAALFGRAPALSARERRLADRIGVTRVARITGLDRLGVEVAAAIRPRGYVLQVSNGKGATLARARTAALMEAAELHYSETPRWPSLIFGSVAELRARWGERLVSPDELGPVVAPELLTPRTVLAWVRADSLFDGGPLLVPACAVYCPPPGGPLLGPAVLRWTTNGCAAHWTLAGATEHGLFEVIERDHLARALPEGWTPAVRRREIPLTPGAARLVKRFAAAGVEARLFDLRPTGAAAFVAGALLLEPGGPVPLAAGYAASADPERAQLSALHEAAQTRLTDIHGAREDVEAGEGTLELGAARSTRSRPWRSVDPLRQLDRLGVRQVARVLLAGRDEGVYVTKVLVPGLLLSELL
jgi:ribosomal protein S12 methylthiotransferase accessory factor